MIDEAELLRQYATDKSDSAFAELVRRHVDLVYSVALPKVGGDVHSARDVSQAVFLALARNAASLAQRRSVVGWLYLTTHHLSAQWVRADQRRHLREHQAHVMKEIFDSPDIDWNQLRPLLDEAMLALSQPDREALLLRYYEQRAFAEIGAALQVSEDAARMRVDRALDKLRGWLAHRGVVSTAAALTAVLGRQVVAAPVGFGAAISKAVISAAAVAAGSLGTTTSFFMNLPTIVSTALALAAIGTSVYFSHESNHRAAELAATRQERDALQSRLDRLESHSIANEQKSAQLRTQVNARRMNAPTSAPATAVTDPADAERAHAAKISAEEQQLEIARGLVNYGPLFRKLNLSPTQVADFKTLLAENIRWHLDLREVVRSQALAPDDPDVKSVNAQTDADLAARVTTSFGDATYQAFAHFNETAPMREVAGHLASSLAASATPLRAEQVEPLVEILNNNRTPEGRASGDPHALDLEAVVAQAQSLLSPPQLAALLRVQSDRP
jgi:RNA polymerase sigma factor (sigma-70 family)